MGKINMQRVFLGGLLAGVVLNVVDFILYGVVLKDDIAAAMQALGKQMEPPIVLFVIWDFVFGIFLVWLYAAIRPRFGAGAKTAVIAGFAVWVLYGLMHSIGEAPMGFFPQRFYVLGTIVMLVQVPVATVVGAWLYKEA